MSNSIECSNSNISKRPLEVFYKKVALRISKRFYLYLWQELLSHKVKGKSKSYRYVVTKNELAYSYSSKIISTATENLF